MRSRNLDVVPSAFNTARYSVAALTWTRSIAPGNITRLNPRSPSSCAESNGVRPPSTMFASNGTLLANSRPICCKCSTVRGASINKTSALESIQIDLRGKRVDVALRETEKFIDTALVSGVGFVNILHGKGTGALMEAIHDFLGNQSFVTHFQFADEDRGGTGITVVELK